MSRHIIDRIVFTCWPCSVIFVTVPIFLVNYKAGGPRDVCRNALVMAAVLFLDGTVGLGWGLAAGAGLRAFLAESLWLYETAAAVSSVYGCLLQQPLPTLCGKCTAGVSKLEGTTIMAGALKWTTKMCGQGQVQILWGCKCCHDTAKHLISVHYHYIITSSIIICGSKWMIFVMGLDSTKMCVLIPTFFCSLKKQCSCRG